jgi:predicted transcriptional regulator
MSKSTPAVEAELPPTIDLVTELDRRSKRQRQSPDPVARYLGELQAAVMEILWRRDSATVREVADELNKKRSLAYTTVLTLVSRLFARDLLTREPEGRGFRYRATKSREEFLAQLSDQLIDRLFADFGAIGVARVGERLNELNEGEKQRLGRGRKKA